MENKTIKIFVLGAKGGIGKSAIAREIACRIPESFLLDTDNLNGVHVGFFNDTSKCQLLGQKDILNLSKQNTNLPPYVIIDTKGGFDDLRLKDAIPNGDIFIIPVTPSAGSILGLKNTILKLDEVLLSEAKDKKVIIVLNAVKAEKDWTAEYCQFAKDMVESIKLLSENLKHIQINGNVSMIKIEQHDVVQKSENQCVSIQQLKKEHDERFKYKKLHFTGIDRDFTNLVKTIKGE